MIKRPITQAFSLCLGLGLAAPGAALAEPSAPGASQVEKLAGCFAVTYRFAEDGVRDIFGEEYGLEEPVKEWIALEEEEGDGRLTVMHYAIGPDGDRRPHFHEVWTSRPDEDAWTQEVWSSSPDNPGRELRYRCTAPWEGNRWQCHAGKAAKPFRDDGAPFGFDRTDYSWLDRDNTVLVTDNGWVHSQSNEKVTEDGEVVGFELGWITYRRLADDRCGDQPTQ